MIFGTTRGNFCHLTITWACLLLDFYRWLPINSWCDNQSESVRNYNQNRVTGTGRLTELNKYFGCRQSHQQWFPLWEIKYLSCLSIHFKPLTATTANEEEEKRKLAFRRVQTKEWNSRKSGYYCHWTATTSHEEHKTPHPASIECTLMNCRQSTEWIIAIRCAA